MASSIKMYGALQHGYVTLALSKSKSLRSRVRQDLGFRVTSCKSGTCCKVRRIAASNGYVLRPWATSWSFNFVVGGHGTPSAFHISNAEECHNSFLTIQSRTLMSSMLQNVSSLFFSRGCAECRGQGKEEGICWSQPELPDVNSNTSLSTRLSPSTFKVPAECRNAHASRQ